jgi:hypothetical protein
MLTIRLASHRSCSRRANMRSIRHQMTIFFSSLLMASVLYTFRHSHLKVLVKSLKLGNARRMAQPHRKGCLAGRRAGSDGRQVPGWIDVYESMQNRARHCS